jgi:hypothetical protein
MSIEEELAQARALVDQKEQAVASADARVLAARKRLALGMLTPEQLVAAQRNLAEAIEAQAAAQADLAKAQEAFEALRKALLDSQAAAIGAVSGEIPLVLLPVRLETRFQTVSDLADLLIRIYPDDLHIDTHEPGLTEEEERWGRNYWEETWRGGASDARERQVWAQIADAFSPQRAAWIVRSLEPQNPDARPQSPIETGQPLPVAPKFPAVTRRAAAQTRAPYAQLMPDQWMAIGYGTAGRAFTALSNPVREPLAAGPAPDLNDQPPPGTGTADAVDADMKWLVDFNEAIAAGMAIRVRLPEEVQGGLSRLVVLGLKHSIDPQASSKRLAALLDAQHYSRGIELPHRGTSTNNSAAGRSGFGAPDIGHERSFAAERRAALSAAGDGSGGDRLATAFGVQADVFAHVQGADDRDQIAQRDVNAALWPSTVGYFLDQRLRGVLIDAELRAVRRHFINYVRSGGPLAPVRFGRQPYGCLPVTSLDWWSPGEVGDPGIRAIPVLQALRGAFRRAVANVPRLEGTDLDQDLIAVLQTQAVSRNHVVRPVLGPEFVENFSALAGIDLNRQWWDAQAALAAPTITIPGLPEITPQSTAVSSALTRPFTGVLAQKSDYPALLAAAGNQQLRTDNFPGNQPRPLLDRLLRHGLLLEYSLAARRLGPQATPLMTDELEPELVDSRTQPTVSIWRRLTARLVGLDPPIEIGAYLDNPENERDPAVTDLAGTRRALRALSRLGADVLEQLLRETLDLASHRLDAWITSVATRRLEVLRRSHPNEVVVGGYSWVEDLKPGSARVSDGYLQGPSPDHAATAAILASGYLSHRASSGSSFAIDLSSKRVQRARQLLEGVRRGGTPAALLGYRIERRLHEFELDVFIQPFRTLAPLDADGGARNVCHGVTLLELWRNRDADPRFRQVVPADATAAQAIDRVFAEIDDVVDALSDILLTESVFQVGRGRRSNIVTSFDGIVRGESFGEAEVLKTPRSGPAFLYRIVAFMPDSASGSPWTIGRERARALAEPRLNAWLGNIFGNPQRIKWRVKGEGSQPVRVVTLSDLDCAPIDVVAMSAHDLGTLVAIHARAIAGSMATVDTGRDPAWPAETITLAEFASCAEAARQLVGKATALGAENLTLPEEELAAGVDVDELRSRADAAVAALGQARKQVKDAGAESTDPATVAKALARAQEFGIETETAEGVAIPLEAVERELARRLEAAERAAAADPVKRETLRMREVFGGSFPVLPRFRPPNGAELLRTWSASAALQGGDPDAAPTWLMRNSMVREGVGRMADVMRHQRALGGRDGSLTVGQLPFRDKDRWCALPFLAGQSLEGRRLSIVAWDGVPTNADSPVSGLLIDEWTERVPAATETTGLAFHYDEPESRAPQAILIAVAPDVSRAWDLDALEAVLLETLDSSKLRMVDADAMVELDQYLPAIYVATNAANEAVSTDL